MKTFLRFDQAKTLPAVARALTVLVAAFAALVVAVRAADAPPRIFNTPEAAVAALNQAATQNNSNAFATLFGSAAQELANPDSVQGANEVTDFAAAFSHSHRLVRLSDTSMILEVGTNAWPFPIPLVKTTGGWQFDTAAGKEEILNRRIGRNELAVLQVMRVYVNAQREYASRDRDGDGVLEYAQRISSTPGQMNGLYWPMELNGEISPFGPLVAYAHGEGYSRRKSAAEEEEQPFHGYFFKILTRQGKDAPGGKYDYIINGNMIAGFALVAWPAEYGDTGVMTFIVNQQGVVHQKDLGKGTARSVKSMRSYNPDKTWPVSAD